MILVVGATGFLGSHLVYHLVKNGYKVRATYRNIELIKQVKDICKYYDNCFPDFHSNIEWVPADITDYDSLSKAFNGVTYVYNCAGYVSFDPRDRERMIKVNVEGTRNLVNLSLHNKITKLLHVSSISALGDTIDGSPVDEECQWVRKKNQSWYSITKFNAETEVWRGSAEGLNMVVVNPSVIIGPGDWDGAGSPSIVKRLSERSMFYPVGSVGLVDVRDLCYVMLKLMESNISNERFVINGVNISYKYLCTTIASFQGKKSPKYKASPRLMEIAWRLDALRALICFSRPVITRSTSRTLSSHFSFSSEKLLQFMSYQYTPIDDTLQYVAACYAASKSREKRH